MIFQANKGFFKEKRGEQQEVMDFLKKRMVFVFNGISFCSHFIVCRALGEFVLWTQ